MKERIMLKDMTLLLEKATIMLDRIEYAHEILKYKETKKLAVDLNYLLESEETAHNINALKDFVKDNEMVIHAFDVEATNVTVALAAEPEHVEPEHAEPEPAEPEAIEPESPETDEDSDLLKWRKKIKAETEKA